LRGGGRKGWGKRSSDLARKSGVPPWSSGKKKDSGIGDWTEGRKREGWRGSKKRLCHRRLKKA